MVSSLIKLDNFEAGQLLLLLLRGLLDVLLRVKVG